MRAADKAALEALDRGTCRLGIPKCELRNSHNQSADGVTQSGRQHGGARKRESAQPCGVVDPRHAWKLHAREPGDPVAIRGRKVADRWEKAMSHKSHMHGGGESYSGIVPAKRSEQRRESAAGGRGGKAADQGEHGTANPYRTQSRESGPSGLDRVRKAAKKGQGAKFTALLHHVNVDLLRRQLLRPEKAGGAGSGWRDVARIWRRTGGAAADLHGRIHRGAYQAKPSRRVWIPKPDGRQRPLGIAALEDKIVQQRWWKFSTRSGKRTFWVFRMDSGRGAASTMHWTRCTPGSCARR